MRSDLMKEGPARAPHRSLLYALGLTESEMSRPFVAVVNSASDYIPGHKPVSYTHLLLPISAWKSLTKSSDVYKRQAQAEIE